MEQFSLEKYLANPPRKVVTRDGKNVRILCTDRKSSINQRELVLVGLVDIGTDEKILTWNEKGKYNGAYSSSYDLFFSPKKHEGWVNLYKWDNRDCAYYMGNIFNSKAEAENKRNTSDNYVATIKFEWEE